MTGILSLAIWTPIVLGIILLLVQNKLSTTLTYRLGNLFGFISFLVTLPLYIYFDKGFSGFQFQEIYPWINHFSINYHLGLDGISLPLVLLTSFISWLVIFISSNSIQRDIGFYISAFLILSGLMIGVFLALDAILYYVFWEAMLIPMFLLIGIWGGPNRVYATIKFFLYTVLGSLLMLVAFIYLYNQTASFAILDFYTKPLSLNIQVLIFLAFFMAFAVKIPMWPVHTWLPDAHVEAPTGGSVILAAIMLKLGGYSFIRFAMPISPDALIFLKPFLIGLSLIAIVYIAFVAIVQTDMKKLIAYSSISHMGFVTLGLFILNPLGFEGGYVQMISHGFISAALFFAIGVLYDRMHSRNISDYRGVINSMPIFGSFFVLFAMANSGLPGTSGFVGEFLVILGAMQDHFWIAFFASLTLIFGATYSLWLVKRIIFGEVKNKKIAALKDLNGKEFFVMSVLALMTLAIGIYPALITDITNQSSQVMLGLIQQSKFYNTMTLSTLLTIAVPEIIILIAAMSVLLLGVFYKNTTSLFGITQLTLLIAAYFTAQLPIDVKLTAFNEMFIVDSLSMFLKLLSYFALSLVLIYSRSFLQSRNLHNGEFYALTLFALLGINLIISSYHLLSLYMGLELLSLSLYTLVAFDRKRPEATEAAMKYFVLGAVASGFLLYGFSMLYGITGSLQIAEISSRLSDASINPVVLSFALVFVVVGIAFKFGAAPFQLWVPDVYQGSATPITMFIGSVPKFASVAMLIRLLFQGLDHMVLDWQAMLLIMAIVSMLFGNITAIAQTKIKRLLAYSAISHVGFMFLGLATGTITGIASVLMYIAVYVLMTLASFGLIIHLSNQGKELDQITDLSGLGKQKPWCAFLLLLIFLSLAGIPPTIGFYAKFSIIQATIQFGWIWPAVIAVMSTLIGIFYYLRIIKVAYFDEPGKNLNKVSKSSNNELSVTLSINTLSLLIIGLFPSSLMDISTLTSVLIF